MKVNITGATSKVYAGLFGYIGGSGVIQNVGVVNSSVNVQCSSGTGSTVGGLCGYLASTVSNSYAIVDVTTAHSGSNSATLYAGGLVGVSDGNLRNSYATGNVTVTSSTLHSIYVGGLLGYNNYNVKNCYSTSNVSATYSSSSYKGIGGLVGYINSQSINNSYAIGNVTVNSSSAAAVGRLVGYKRTDTNPQINESYYLSTSTIDNTGSGGMTVCEEGTSKTAVQFASGEVAYLLNDSTSTGDDLAWYQSIDNGIGPDAYPLLRSERGTVYQSTPCGKASPNYSNYDSGTSTEHSFDSNGFCTRCGAYEPCGGSGTSSSPYTISNAGQLYWFACVVNDDHLNCEDYYASNSRNGSAYGKLTADITIPEGRLWKPIGGLLGNSNAYGGTFDGQNHTINGINVNMVGSSSSEYMHVGLFGYVSVGRIRNLSIDNSNFSLQGSVSTYGFLGSIAARVVSSSSEITNCHVEENVITTATISGNAILYAGGISGSNTGMINDSYSKAYVDATGSGYVYAGGLAGYYNYYSPIDTKVSKSYATGSVKASGLYAYSGGLVGSLYGSTSSNAAEINNCYATGSVTAAGTSTSVAGGLVGDQNFRYALINNTYAIGNVSVSGSGSNYVGRLVGRQINNATVVGNSYYLNTSTIPSSGVTTCTVGTSKTAAQFASGEETFLLNQGQDIAWYQSIDNNLSPHDAYPLLDSSRGIVYKGCNAGALYYSNSPDDSHTFDNGFCRYCGAYQSCEGEGTSESPYLIDNAGKMYWFAAVVNGDLDKCAKPSGTLAKKGDAYGTLTADITLNSDISSESARLWTPIGRSAASTYRGVFNGQNHTISGMKINITGATSTVFAGLFGYVYGSGEVENVGIIDSSVTASSSNTVYAGGLIGYCGSGASVAVSNCYVTCPVSVTSSSGIYAGGLIARCQMGSSTRKISNSYATGSVSAISTGTSDYAGGLVGFFSGCTLDSCYATGSVTSAGSGNHYTGGLVGRTENTGIITNTYATGAVNVTTNTNSHAGGLVGSLYGSITNSYAIGSVDIIQSNTSGADIWVGGLVGAQWGGSINNTYATGPVSATGCNYVVVGGLIGYVYGGTRPLNSYAIGDVTVNSPGPKRAGKLIGWNKISTSENLYYLDSSIITHTGEGEIIPCDEGTSKTATEFNNFAVKDLLQTYVNTNTTVSNPLSSWVQAVDKPEFSWDNHELSTNLSWGNMTFAYDPEEGTWALPEGDEGENIVTFVNGSTNAKLRYNAVFDIASGLSGITGGVAHSAGDVTYQGATWPMVDSPEMVVSSSPNTDSRTTTLTLSGTPSGGNFNRTTPESPMEIGVITLTISG